MDLRVVSRLGALLAIVLLGIVFAAQRQAAGDVSGRPLVGTTAQGQPIRLRVVAGDLRSLSTRLRLRCTDGRTLSVRWTPGSDVARIAGLAGGAVSVLQIDRTHGITARLDGRLGSAPSGTMRAIGARDGVRCDSGAVRWSAAA